MNRRIFDWPLLNESSRNNIKRIVSKIWTAEQMLDFSTRVFFISRRFIYERSATNIRDLSLAYSLNPGFSLDKSNLRLWRWKGGRILYRLWTSIAIQTSSFSAHPPEHLSPIRIIFSVIVTGIDFLSLSYLYNCFFFKYSK